MIEISAKNPKLGESRFASLNIRSLKNHLDVAKLLVFQYELNILSFTETWLREEDMSTIKHVCPPECTSIYEDRHDQ